MDGQFEDAVGSYPEYVPEGHYADITIVLDKSGSMGGKERAVIDGFNEYVRKMRETPGDTRWTLLQFDDHDSHRGANEPFPSVTFSGRGEVDVPLLEETDYRTRGGTALVDALYRTVEEKEHRTSGQPGITNVVMVITDGHENSSRQYKSAQLRELIARTQVKGWQYMFLGANIDSFAEAGGMGIQAQAMNMPGLAASSQGSGGGYVYNWDPTAGGVMAAIGSGFVGLAAVTSGSVGSGAVSRTAVPLSV